MKGTIILISGPSGSGKTTLRKLILERNPGIAYSVSYTTRKERPGEVDGVDYFFVSVDEFRAMIARNEFLEYADVYGNLYGTSKGYVEKLMDRGLTPLLELDVQGGENVMRGYDDVCSIFILPPSLEVLRERFLARGTESPGDAEKRMHKALAEIEKKVLYRFHVVNDTIENAYAKIMEIIGNFPREEIL